MQPSWRLAVSSLGGRRGRTVLMAGATVLASSLVAVVSCAVSSSQASFERGLTRFLGAADARIIHAGGGRFDESLLDTIGGWPEVRAVAGRLGAALHVVPADGEHPPGRRRTPTAIGVDFAAEAQVRPLELVRGRVPAARDEVLVDPLTVEQLGVDVGEALAARGPEDSARLAIVGVYERQKLGTLQRPRLYIDRSFLAELTGHAGEVSSAYIMLEEGADVEAFCSRRQQEVADPLLVEPAEMVRAGFDDRLRAARIGLVIGSVMALLGASVIILVGLTSGITERQRELALLRCIGASRQQLFTSQLFVGLAFGLVGAGLGVPLGIGIAGGLVAVFREYLPAGLVIDRPGVMLALAGSVVSGLLGALYPATLASLVPPLRAMARPAVAVRWRSVAACGVAGAAFLGVQLLLLLPADDDLRFWSYVAVGLPCLVAGWFLLTVPLLVLVNAVIARPLAAALRLPADLLRGSVAATPFRNGFTAGALMMGLALLVDAWVSGAALHEDWLGQIRFADGFAMRITGITPGQQEAIAALPFVEGVCPIGYLPARLVGDNVFGVEGLSPSVVCVGFDPDRFFAMNAVEWKAGDPETAIRRLADGDCAIVADQFLVAKDFTVGDRITLGVGRTTKEFEIVGVVSSAGLDLATQLFGIRAQYMEYAVSCVFVDFETVASVFDNPNAYMLQVNLADDVTDEAATAAIETAAPGVHFRSGRWIVDTVAGLTNTAIRIQSTIAFAALLIASIAVGHVIAANIQGRRFELGVLRSVGTGRGVLVRLLLAEATIIAITGAILGTALGFHIAWIDTINLRYLVGIAIGVPVPAGPILGAVAVLLALTLLASAPAAVRIARTPPARLVAAGRND